MHFLMREMGKGYSYCTLLNGVLLTSRLDFAPTDVISWGSAKLGANADVATAAASFGIGVVGNIWARMTGHSSITGNT